MYSESSLAAKTLLSLLPVLVRWSENKKQLHHCTSAIKNRTSIPLDTTSKHGPRVGVSSPDRQSSRAKYLTYISDKVRPEGPSKRARIENALIRFASGLRLTPLSPPVLKPIAPYQTQLKSLKSNLCSSNTSMLPGYFQDPLEGRLPNIPRT